MSTRFLMACLAVAAIVSHIGCDRQLTNQLQRGLNDLTELVEDPLGVQPYPILIGGDDENVYYATNLFDIPFELPGTESRFLFPAVGGPSNIYGFTSKSPELVRALAPAGSPYFEQLVTDGRFVAFVQSRETEDGFVRESIVVEDLQFGPLAEAVRVEIDSVGGEFLDQNLLLDSGLLATVIYNTDTDISRFRMIDLLNDVADIEFEAGQTVHAADLKGSRLAYIATVNQRRIAVLRDLPTGQQIVLSDDVLGTGFSHLAIFLTDNSAVWSEQSAPNLVRVFRHDIPTGQTTVWTTDESGRLFGATDAFLLFEDFLKRDDPFVAGDRADRIMVRRVDRDGKSKEIGDFRIDGLAGQARVIGNRAVFVNGDRKVVIVPFDGRNRNSFKPF